MESLADIFAPDGLLEARLSDYTFRAGQLEMAELIWQSFADGRHAAIEAGTGIGKTYAYLVPVLLSGRRTIVSTGTKTLQDQLFAKDLPALGAAIGRPGSVAVLKGRNNYLCWHRLALARADLSLGADVRDALNALEQWGRAGSSGDISELEDLQDDFVLRASITSTAENCLGSDCAFIDRCFVAEARRRAQAARIVIVNHHLLLADLALKDAGFGELLGHADSVIVDEAHLLPDIAQQFFGIAASTREIELLIKDTIAELGIADLASRAHEGIGMLERSVGAIRRGARGRDGKLPWRAVGPSVIDGIAECRDGIRSVAGELAGIADATAGITRCRERYEDLAARLTQILEADAEDGLRWIDVGARSMQMHWTPLEVGASLARRIGEQGANWIFTSATLAVAGGFEHFLGRLGLSDALTAVVPSPFDYERNARIYLPQGLPEPRDPAYVAALMAEVWPLIEAAGGGAFILFTSYRALREAERWLAVRSAPGPVLVQGAGSRSRLLEQFRAAAHAVLLGTSSFWQGVDVRGEALRIVIIEKLPFAAPNDPLVEARCEAIRRRGGDAFIEWQLPQAILTLKQGIGRLIRDFADRGLLVIADPRLRTRGYGSAFLDNLPPAPILDEASDALAFAASLAAPRAADELVPREVAGH